jgi:hypothetical protein
MHSSPKQARLLTHVSGRYAVRYIKIIEKPPGEAPPQIRSAWIGVVLPLADIPHPQPGIWNTIGVLGKHHSLFAKLKRLFRPRIVEQPTPSYVVDVIAAVACLREKSPSAASWWEHHTPHLFKSGQMFCFDASCCEEVTPG